MSEIVGGPPQESVPFPDYEAARGFLKEFIAKDTEPLTDAAGLKQAMSGVEEAVSVVIRSRGKFDHHSHPVQGAVLGHKISGGIPGSKDILKAFIEGKAVVIERFSEENNGNLYDVDFPIDGEIADIEEGEEHFEAFDEHGVYTPTELPQDTHQLEGYRAVLRRGVSDLLAISGEPTVIPKDILSQFED